MEYVGHVFRGSAGLDLVNILKPKEHIQRKSGRPRITWYDEVKHMLNGSATIDNIIQQSSDHASWKSKIISVYTPTI